MVLRFLEKYFFLILAVLIAVFGYIYISVVGNEYTYVRKDINVSSGITDVRIDEESKGRIEIISWEVSDSGLTARLRSVAPGRVDLSFVGGEHPGNAVFYVHKNGVITSELFFGDCTGCKAVYVCIMIYLVMILVYLVVKYIMFEKKNFYSYDNVLYLGLIIFAFFFIFAVIRGICIKGGIYGVFQEAITSSQYFVLFTFPLVIATTVFVTISNIKLIRKEGRTWKNMLGVFLGLALGIGAVLLGTYATTNKIESMPLMTNIRVWRDVGTENERLIYSNDFGTRTRIEDGVKATVLASARRDRMFEGLDSWQRNNSGTGSFWLTAGGNPCVAMHTPTSYAYYAQPIGGSYRKGGATVQADFCPPLAWVGSSGFARVMFGNDELLVGSLVNGNGYFGDNHQFYFNMQPSGS